MIFKKNFFKENVKIFDSLFLFVHCQPFRIHF